MTISGTSSSGVNTAAGGAVSAAVPTLNPYQRIPVIRLSTDLLNYEAENGTIKTISVTELGDAIATAAPLVIPKIKLDIPVPKIENVITYEKDLSSNYIIQNSFVRYHRDTPTEFYNTLEYIADLEDEIWWYSQYHSNNHNNRSNNINNNSTSMNNSSRRQQQSGATTPIDLTREDDDYYKIESLLTTNNMAYPTNNNTISNRDSGGGRNNNNRKFPNRIMIFPLRMLEHMLDLLEKATAFESIITENEADILLQTKLPQLYLMFPNDNNITTTMNTNTSSTGITQQQLPLLKAKMILNDVYNYWVHKRSKLKRPLLRKYWPITSSDDTNPHLVFRQRINNNDRDKYKLRARRVRSSTVINTITNNQNNELIIKNTIKKMKYIQDDLQCYHNVLSSMIQREEVYKIHIISSIELFQQRLYDLIDTSGLPRKSKRFKKSVVYNQLEQQGEEDNNDFYYCYDEASSSSPNNNTTMTMGGKRNIVRIKNEDKRSSSATHHHHSDFTNTNSSSLFTNIITNPSSNANDGTFTNAATTDTTPNYNEIYTNIAGKNNGEPAPNFLHPLTTRVSYHSNYNHYEPYIRTYDVNSQIQPTNRFRHRPRIGRGGRVIIDRVPQENYHNQTSWNTSNGNNGTTNNNRSLSPPTVYIAGKPLLPYNNPKDRLLDLLPRPLNHNTLSRKIEAISVAAIHEDYYEHAVAQAASTTNAANTAGGGAAGQYQQHHRQTLPYPTATSSNSMMMMMAPQQQHQQYQQQVMNMGGGISSGGTISDVYGSSTMGGSSISTIGRYPVGNESQRPMLSTTTMQQQLLGGGVPQQSSSLLAYNNNELYDNQLSDFDNKISASASDYFDEVIVPVEEYIETDDQLWGEELYSLGPI